MNAPRSDSLSVKQAAQPRSRVWAPFSGRRGLAYDPQKPATWGNRSEAFYCHHYQQPEEHYHRTVAELDACDD